MSVPDNFKKCPENKAVHSSMFCLSGAENKLRSWFPVPRGLTSTTSAAELLNHCPLGAKLECSEEKLQVYCTALLERSYSWKLSQKRPSLEQEKVWQVWKL